MDQYFVDTYRFMRDKAKPKTWALAEAVNALRQPQPPSKGELRRHARALREEAKLGNFPVSEPRPARVLDEAEKFRRDLFRACAPDADDPDIKHVVVGRVKEAAPSKTAWFVHDDTEGKGSGPYYVRATADRIARGLRAIKHDVRVTE